MQTLAVSKCLSDNWISSDGPVVIEFEDTFRDCATKVWITVTNGTTALDRIARVGLTKDDGGCPDFMIISCAWLDQRWGAPCLCRRGQSNLEYLSKKVRELVTPQNSRMLVAHVYHFPAEMDDSNKLLTNLASQ